MFKAAVVGLGNIGMLYDFEPQRPHPSTHVYAYEMSEGFQLMCGIDGDPNKEKLFRDNYPHSDYYRSLKDAEKSGAFEQVDVVSICTPPETHFEIVSYLIHNYNPKAIFCEKPLVKNMDEACKLRNLVNSSSTLVIPNISRRWNYGLREISRVLNAGQYGKLEKINIRYTRGIYNTGAHLFDLLKMWTNSPISRVLVLGETETSAYPEVTYSFYFEMDNGVTGYAEAIDDRKYYMFDVDLFCSEGKIEMRNSGDDIYYYTKAPHHLFQGFEELFLKSESTNQLNDSCMKNAIDNLEMVLRGNETPKCELEDAIYPLCVARALEKSNEIKDYVEVQL